MGRKSFEVEQKAPLVSDIDWARLAAFIDGEGSIMISVLKANRRPHHRLQVVVSNTNINLMTWLKRTFGGSVYSSNWDDGRKKRIFRWQLNERQAEIILKGVERYLLIKQEQALLALAFKASKWQRRWGSDRLIPDEILQERENFRAKIRALNQASSVVSIAS